MKAGRGRTVAAMPAFRRTVPSRRSASKRRRRPPRPPRRKNLGIIAYERAQGAGAAAEDVAPDWLDGASTFLGMLQ